MQFESIADIYCVNDKIRDKLVATLAPLTEEQTTSLPEGEKWTIAQIVEHISMVSGGIHRICAKLLSKAEAAGNLSDGTIDLSVLAAKSADSLERKLEAPEFVHPTGEKSVANSLETLNEIRSGLLGLQPLFEKYDGNSARFPHPYFGDLSALEWLALAGGHESRHTRQIRNILTKIG